MREFSLVKGRVLATLLAALLVFALVPLSGCAQEQTKQEPGSSEDVPIAAVEGKLAIIHTNDIHGFDAPAEPTEYSAGVMGLAAVVQLKKEYEAQGYEVILVDSGDFIQGNNLVNLSQGKTAIEFLNAAGYDAMTLGNHEFDWGADVLAELIDKSTVPVISANVLVDATNESFVPTSTVVELKNGAKVGIFGLTTPETATKTSPKNVAGLSFFAGEELYACAQDQVYELQAAGCAFVICLGHLGSAGGVEPDRSLDVLEHTEGIDLFIDGHDHAVVDQRVNDTLLVSTGSYLENIGVVLYEDGVLREEMVAYGSFDGLDEEIAALVDEVDAEVSAQLSEVIGTSEVDLNGERDPGVRTEETNLGDFAADASLWQAQQVSDEVIDGAIVNGGSIRASIDAGDISMSTLKTVFPYNNSLNVVRLSGAQLLETLEAATFSSPLESGGFPQVAGITYTLDTTVPYEQGAAYPDSTFYAPANPGARVTITDVGGKGFDLSAEYSLAVSSFLTDGGDTYYVVAQAYVDNGYITGISDSDALIHYINAELGGRIDERYAQAQERITVK